MKITKEGEVVFDKRFNSTLKDANIECYGVSPTRDGGFIETCGEGVEPDVYPDDPQ